MSESKSRRRLIIVGSGPAGWTAAIYAARAGLKPLVITGMEPGGQLTITGDVENYPGFAEPVSGPKLMDEMFQQALANGAEIEYDVIADIDVTATPFVLHGELDEYIADAVIIATGATARWLGVKGEADFRGKGVSACATCDGPLFKGKVVAVIGGGNTAVEEALHLAAVCERVHLIHRRNHLTAEKVLIDRIGRTGNIEFHWGTELVEIKGEPGLLGGVTDISLTDGLEQILLPVDGVFVAIGHDPSTGWLKGKIELDSDGYVVVTSGRTETNIPGIFAAGDVADRHYRQAVTAAGMGCMAALDADRWLSTR